ncbi:multi-copper polyphenol oxidoreductase laccase [Bacteriovorax sp. BAL6_X]|uniref:polyphenol oxidase family protein n=1 Tax=Bacteriovorax sp. BAL6_X TaxID=1201290 RepID=UPI0003862E9E|nr:polyphenol oxidase family protein [Bacteriovorax sp. BAL6_X]EPZ50087.1 multi-copper polyphenol oxidoreductase laccase [Bacteriovorax sp. BAL6_X]
MAKLLYQKKISNYLFEVYDDRPDFDFDEVNQIHSSTVVNAPASNNNEADAIISGLELERPLAIKTADCLPIVIIGKSGVANIHAGWRGLAEQIILDSEIKRIEPEIILIGPHISAVNYEVSEEFKQNFPNSQAFAVIEGKTTFSLEKELRAKIAANFSNAHVISTNICTFANLNYNSFRRNQTTKRNYNILKRN